MNDLRNVPANGAVEHISPLVRRILAPNPGMMTGPGTNTYLVGRDRVAVIDPGTDDPHHLQRIVDAGAGRIEWILVTHTHPDHSTGSRALQAMTGATVHGHHIALRGVRDDTFDADAYLDEGDRVEAGDFHLRVLHTPGHAANHLCFMLEEEGLLFAGDHVMDGATVVINPPDGDMEDYLRSLRRLKHEGLRRIAPGHGRVLERPEAVLDHIIAHRLARERQILDYLRASGPLSVAELVSHIYRNVPISLHAMAARSVLAHLYKLQSEHLVALNARERWCVDSH